MTEIIYVIECAYSRRVKIGRTTNPVQRFRALYMAAPTDLRLLGIISGNETDVHRELAPWRLHGEWFENGPEVQDFLRNTLIGYPVALAQIHNDGHLPMYLLEDAA